MNSIIIFFHTRKSINICWLNLSVFPILQNELRQLMDFWKLFQNASISWISSLSLFYRLQAKDVKQNMWKLLRRINVKFLSCKINNFFAKTIKFILCRFRNSLKRIRVERSTRSFHVCQNRNKRVINFLVDRFCFRFR